LEFAEGEDDDLGKKPEDEIKAVKAEAEKKKDLVEKKEKEAAAAEGAAKEGAAKEGGEKKADEKKADFVPPELAGAPAAPAKWNLLEHQHQVSLMTITSIES